jgi:hypothetical protein
MPEMHFPAEKCDTLAYSAVDRMINEYGAFGGITIDRVTELLVENLPQCHFVNNKYHMT